MSKQNYDIHKKNIFLLLTGALLINLLCSFILLLTQILCRYILYSTLYLFYIWYSIELDQNQVLHISGEDQIYIELIIIKMNGRNDMKNNEILDHSEYFQLNNFSKCIVRNLALSLIWNHLIKFVLSMSANISILL